MIKAIKEICVEILKSVLSVLYYGKCVQFNDLEKKGKVVYRGAAQGWEKYREKIFQDFIKKHNIKPDDKIAIAYWIEEWYMVKLETSR